MLRSYNDSVGGGFEEEVGKDSLLEVVFVLNFDASFGTCEHNTAFLGKFASWQRWDGLLFEQDFKLNDPLKPLFRGDLRVSSQRSGYPGALFRQLSISERILG